jgi:hypothetical protein
MEQKDKIEGADRPQSTVELLLHLVLTGFGDKLSGWDLSDPDSITFTWDSRIRLKVTGALEVELVSGQVGYSDLTYIIHHLLKMTATCEEIRSDYLMEKRASV